MSQVAISSVLSTFLARCAVQGLALPCQKEASSKLLEQLIAPAKFEVANEGILFAGLETNTRRILVLAQTIGEVFGPFEVMVDAAAYELSRTLASEYATWMRSCLSSQLVMAWAGEGWDMDAIKKVTLRASLEPTSWWTSPNYVLANGLESPDMWMGSPTFCGRAEIPGWVSPGWLMREDAMKEPQELIADVPQTILQCEAVPESIRTYSINSRQDFRVLAENFPRAIGDGISAKRHQLNEMNDSIRWIIDWARVAETFDAVYMSAEGYLDTEWVPLDLSEEVKSAESLGGKTIASAWAPEATYWLRRPAVSLTAV